MFAHINFYSLILIVSGVITTVLATFLYLRFRKVGKYSAYLLFLTSLWMITSGLCQLQSNGDSLLLIVKVQYIAVAFFPSFYILFIIHFLNNRYLIRDWRTALLFIEPAITLLLVWTSEWHHFYYSNIDIQLREGITLFHFTRGPWYYIHTLYFYGCLITGIALLQVRIGQQKHVFSRQKQLIVFATLIPAISNILYLAGVRPAPGVDITPFSFTATALILAFGLYKFNLFDILPIAREQIIEELKEGVMVIDEDGRIVYINPRMQQILQSREKHIIGNSLRTFFPQLTDTVAEQGEIEITGREGAVKIFAVTISGFENLQSGKSGKTFLFTDISEQKALEKTLREAKDAAEQATKAKSEFLSVMSHEIRTPMNAVIGFTTLLLQNAREDQQEYLNMLRFSGENLLALINEILDYNKIEAGKIELEWVDFDLKTLLHNIAGNSTELAREKGIGLQVIYDSALPTHVAADPIRIGQILTNLVSNAVKFTQKGHVDLNARLLEEAGERLSVLFEVVDTGIGIEEDKQAMIFDSFTQASSETTRKYGGTGLGLAISKRIIELYGSSISLESKPGKGSRFQFVLPLKKSKQRGPSTVPAVNNKSKDLQGIRVLLAEDNKINVVVIKQFLKQWGISCDVAENGRIAVDLVMQKNYDLILMDLQMPLMDGYQASEAIRGLTHPEKKVIPIIALTAAGIQEVQEKIKKAGMQGTVSKPFDPVELFEKIRSQVQPLEQQGK